MATVLMLFVFSGFVVSGFAQSSVFAPIWMKEGAYVEYSFGEGIRFPSSDSRVVTYKGGTYRWECVELTGTLAKLSLTLRYNETDGVKQFSGEALVDAVNRSVYSLDETLLGTTQLWLESNPADGEQVVLWDLPPDKIVATINAKPLIINTIQGKQEAYQIIANGTIGGNMAVFNPFCDMNTGLMIFGLLWNEGTLRALNTSIVSSMTMSDTNIDLGPNENVFDFGALLPPILIVAAFVFVFVTIYWKRSKKRSQHTNISNHNDTSLKIIADQLVS
jgi:hypothetical protein